ncbi:unnamed protein product [Cuscuta epithymum]|uniref:F-box domain-containing protein n=1 Tax=Cuscuta epithymum TaxID=186058 RepID=A0AAV0EBH4_9ASTE|nr:unnamed protein product [Cuscuta epithymum]
MGRHFAHVIYSKSENGNSGGLGLHRKYLSSGKSYSNDNVEITSNGSICSGKRKTRKLIRSGFSTRDKQKLKQHTSLTRNGRKEKHSSFGRKGSNKFARMIETLNEDVMREILLKLPLYTLSCIKRWVELASDPSFKAKYMALNTVLLGFAYVTDNVTFLAPAKFIPLPHAVICLPEYSSMSLRENIEVS